MLIDKDIINSASSSDRDETEFSANGESYAADSEGSSSMFYLFKFFFSKLLILLIFWHTENQQK